VTVSIGYTGVAADMPPPVALDIADRALYDAKHGGRNRIVRGCGIGGPRREGEVEMF
jgi:PleD family two-component response regulator